MVGLLGGTFDPPHNGHLALARAAVDHFALDRLVVVPTGVPPLKRDAPCADAETRLRLAEAAFGTLAGVEVSRVDVDRSGPSYSEETARWAAHRYGDVVFLVGADRFLDFPRWHDPDGVLACVRLGVATRPGYAHGFGGVLEALARPERVELFEVEPVDVSSSEIRRRVARGEEIVGLVPAAVAALIQRLGLYRPVEGRRYTDCGSDREGS